MTTRDGLPAAGSLAIKKFRVRRCTQKLYLPNGVTFSCQREKHVIEEPHKEVGYVLMPNGTARKYEISWTDEGFAELRQHRGKLRTVK